VLTPGEELLAVWSTRGFGANALICTPGRALISKRPDHIRWSVGVFPYAELAGVEMLDSRPGATQVELQARVAAEPERPFADFPDAYYQDRGDWWRRTR
jgi:hypothetical protein